LAFLRTFLRRLRVAGTLRARGMVVAPYLWSCLYLGGNGPDDATGHAFRQNLILSTGSGLLDGAFSTQMPLPGLAEFNFPGTGYLKSFGDAFVRLLHDVMRKSVQNTFFLWIDQAK